MKKNIVIIILSILLILLSGYILYDKVLNKKNEITINSDKTDNLQNSNNNSNETNKEEDITEIKDDNEINNQEDINESNNNLDNNQNLGQIGDVELKKYEEIIEKQLLKLLGFKSISEASNQDKLAMVFEIYKNKYDWKKEIRKSDIITTKENSVLKNIDVNYTNLGDYNMVFNYGENGLYQLDNNKQVYVYQETGHAPNDMSIIHKELLKSNIKKDEVKLSYKYLFAKTHKKTTSTTPGYHSLYYSLDDVLYDAKNKDKKMFKEFSFMDVYEEVGKAIAYDKAKSYILENYETIKDNLYTYNFVFTIEDNNIILKDYYRE